MTWIERKRDSLPVHNTAHMLSLRKNELFPQPVDFGSYYDFNNDAIPKEVLYGSVIDVIHGVPCQSCGRKEVTDNYKYTLVCNICGAVMRASRRERASTFREHLITHGAPNNSNQDTCGVYDMVLSPSTNYKLMQSLQKLVHTNDGCCARCVMCGCEYDSENVVDGVIKLHVERCKRIIELRTANRTMPNDLIGPKCMPPHGSPAYFPLRTDFYSASYREYYYKIFKEIRQHKNYPLTNALAEIKMCEHCAEPKIRCRICNVYVIAYSIQANITGMALIHLTDISEAKNCLSGIKNQFAEHSQSAEKMATRKKMIKKINTKDSKHLLELISNSGCIICGDVFDSPNMISFNNHMKKHENDGTTATLVSGL